MGSKERIDVLLVKRGYFQSREQAKRAIMAGEVFVKNERVDKPGYKVNDNNEIIVKSEQQKYVGRGGYKLDKAIKYFELNLNDIVALDIGASTGGFTDCMLQHGAKKVYAIDVGYNQLAWKLRQDKRVIVKERYNFRYAKPEDFSEDTPMFATIDVSFISLKLILPPLTKIIALNSNVVALIKPQFEAGREEVGKKGIVRDPNTHVRVLHQIIQIAQELGFSVSGLTYSPITGGDGNIEFLMLLKWTNHNETKNLSPPPEEVVQQAHKHLLQDN